MRGLSRWTWTVKGFQEGVKLVTVESGSGVFFWSCVVEGRKREEVVNQEEEMGGRKEECLGLGLGLGLIMGCARGCARGCEKKNKKIMMMIVIRKERGGVEVIECK